MKNSKFLLSATLIALLTACGGGGGSDSTTAAVTPAATPTTTTLTGTAATGAALANATITVKDSKGAKKATTADANGNFSIDVTGMTAPLIIQAVNQGKTKTYYAMAQTIPASNVINVTSITDSLAQASGQTPSAVFDDPVTKFASVDFAKLATAQNNLKTALTAYMTALGISTTADLTTTAFAADNTKVDALLDCLSSVSGTLSVKASCTGGAAVQAFDPINVATAPATLAAPEAGTLGYVSTNLPLISAQIKKISDSLNGVSGDLATVLAATVDANGSYDEGMNKTAFIADQVAKFKAGDRGTLYPGALVGFDKTANTVDQCLDEAGTASGQALAGTTGATFKWINGVWQVTTTSAAARAACEKAKISIRAVSEYLTGSSGPLVSSLYSSYAVCVGKAPKKALGAALTDEHCGAFGVSSATFDLSSWTPASGTVTLVAYIKRVSDNKVFSAELGGGVVTLNSAGSVTFGDLNICAKSATPDTSVKCSIDIFREDT